MLNLSQYSLMAGLLMVVVAVTCYILALTMGHSVRRAPAKARPPVGARVSARGGPGPAPVGREEESVVRAGVGVRGVARGGVRGYVGKGCLALAVERLPYHAAIERTPDVRTAETGVRGVDDVRRDGDRRDESIARLRWRPGRR